MEMHGLGGRDNVEEWEGGWRGRQVRDVESERQKKGRKSACFRANEYN